MPLHFTQLPPALIDAAAADQVLTANERLAREFTAAYEERQIQLGRRAWPQPQAASIGRYWRRRFAAQAGANAAKLLSREAELLLWRELADPEHAHLAELAAEAWRLAHSWRIDLDADLQPATASALLLQRWAQGFRRRLQQDSLITQAQLPDRIGVEERTVHLLGFDQLNRQEADFCARCTAAGGAVHRHQPPPVPAQQARRVRFGQRTDEISAAAQWARQTLADEPSARIGIVFPYLTEAYHSISHALRVEFADAPNAYDIAGGASLADQPVWRSAERLLRHLAAPTPEGGEALQRAPFFGFRASPAAALEWAATAPNRQPFAEWVVFFAAMLRRANWGKNAGSAQRQAQQAILKRLEQYAELAQLPDIGNLEAVQTLRELLAQSTFAAERPAAPILALGYLETTGLHFSHLWVAGMTDTGWPMSRPPNPLLPLPLLRRRGVPRIDHEAEAQFARRRLDQWRNSCRFLVASWAGEDGGEQHECSALLMPLAANPAGRDGGEGPDRSAQQEPFREASAEELIRRRRRLWHPWLPELPRVELQPAPPDQATPRSEERLQGGAALLRDQAQCPFKAWAQHRLRLRPPSSSDVLPDALARGLLVHSALFALYDGNQAPFSAAQLDAAAAAAVAEHIAEAPAIYRQNEHRRLVELLERWLEREAKRPEFAVLGLEQEVTLTLAEAEFALRVDRIDQDKATNRLIIIDYKTGKVSAERLLNERLTEPQLPMYALTDERVGAALFATVGGEEEKLDGFAAPEVEQLPGARPAEPSWEALRSQWRTNLEALIQEHLSGEAAVAPFPNPANACRYCHLPALCRINALQAGSAGMSRAQRASPRKVRCAEDRAHGVTREGGDAPSSGAAAARNA